MILIWTLNWLQAGHYRFRMLSKKMTLVVLLLASMSGYAIEQIPLSKSIYVNDNLPFESHQGAGRLDTVIVMNIQYPPVKSIREMLSTYLQYPLRFHTGWNRDGEAHVTVITSPEYTDVIKKFVSLERMEEIALQNTIQTSDLKVLGLGKCVVNINDKPEEAYFLIIKSKNLLKIRQKIYEEFVKNGGNINAWNPKHFYPHITVGYSLRDLHESDGAIKDVMHSLDNRFELVLPRQRP